ncbi:MAG: hypothetical protein F6K41_43090 [Symploca sp. SIO3E6]|nr:hypothetical protein [Caldora sp. SIO3E6]
MFLLYHSGARFDPTPHTPHPTPRAVRRFQETRGRRLRGRRQEAREEKRGKKVEGKKAPRFIGRR